MNFTAKYNEILDTFKDFRHTGRDIAAKFIPEIAGIFDRNMEKYGICMYTFEGDGVTDAIACGNTTEEMERLRELFHSIHQKLSYKIGGAGCFGLEGIEF